jgi:hypothetical protein
MKFYALPSKVQAKLLLIKGDGVSRERSGRAFDLGFALGCSLCYVTHAQRAGSEDCALLVRRPLVYGEVILCRGDTRQRRQRRIARQKSLVWILFVVMRRSTFAPLYASMLVEHPASNN